MEQSATLDIETLKVSPSQWGKNTFFSLRFNWNRARAQVALTIA